MRARAGDHRAGAPGRYAKASKKDKGRMLDKESIPLLLDLLEASGELDDEPRYQDPQGRRARWRPSPGSSRPVTVAHCGPVLKGEFAEPVNVSV